MILNFKSFLSEAPSEFMSAGGSKGTRHSLNYVRPFLGSNGAGLELGKDHEGIPAGTTIKPVGQHVIDGKHFTEVTPEGNDKSVMVPNSKIKKPQELIKRRGEAGFNKENALADVLKQEGMMRADTATAGSTGGHDFHIKKPSGEEIHGEERPDLNSEIGGESKIHLGAKFGSAFLSHNDEKGWHITDKNRAKKPKFAEAIENATVNVNGKPKPLLQHLNDTWGAPGDRHLPQVTSDTTDDSPAQAYFRDHGAHILHVHSHGTYRVGDSNDQDIHNTQLPTISGMTGRFTVGRERKGGGVQASFRPHKPSLSPSSVDLMKPEDRKQFAQNIAVKPVRGKASIDTTSLRPQEPAPQPATPPVVPVRRSGNDIAGKRI